MIKYRVVDVKNMREAVDKAMNAFGMNFVTSLSCSMHDAEQMTVDGKMEVVVNCHPSVSEQKQKNFSRKIFLNIFFFYYFFFFLLSQEMIPWQ